MTTNTYKVVFAGEIVNGVSQTTVRQNLKIRFGYDEKTLDQLFSGDQVTIRKRLDIETANKYVALFRQEGAICCVVEKPLRPSLLQHEPVNSFLFNETDS